MNELVLPHSSLGALSLWVMTTLPQASLPLAVPVALGAVEPVHSTMASGTSPIVGAVVSTRVMVWRPLMLLPHASSAVQVRAMIFVPPHGSSFTTSLKRMETTPPHPSMAVAVPVELVLVAAGHSKVRS